MATIVAKLPRVRVNKNRKKAWNKYCDITDVEKYLEEKRFEERTGGPISEKPDNEIFFVDTDRETVKRKPAKSRRHEKLKCHEILTAYSKVPVPLNVRFGTTKKITNRVTTLLDRKLKNIAQSKHKPKQRTEPGTFHDLWGNVSDSKKDDDSELSEIADLISYGQEIMRKRQIKVPNHLFQKPSLLPAVEVPHPGASYNPAYDDHQDLLRQAVTIEEKKEKHEMHLKRVLLDMFPTKADAPTEKTWIAEMSQGLSDNEEYDTTTIHPTCEVLTVNPAVTTESQKSKSQKKKEKIRKELERRRISNKQKKWEENQVFRIRSMVSEIKAKEKQIDENIAKREKMEIERMYQPHILGKHKYEPNDLEVNLSEELQGSLRGMKVEGNILEDRYKSFQRRNIIEPRIRQKLKRKYKLKKQIKRGHRDPIVMPQKYSLLQKKK